MLILWIYKGLTSGSRTVAEGKMRDRDDIFGKRVVNDDFLPGMAVDEHVAHEAKYKFSPTPEPHDAGDAVERHELVGTGVVPEFEVTTIYELATDQVSST